MKTNTMSLAEWKVEYRKRKDIADRITEKRRNRLVKMCADAGLSPDLLGIHPNNAMIDYRAGKPWPNVNYTIVKKLDYLLRIGWMWEAHEIVSRWDAKVR